MVQAHPLHDQHNFSNLNPHTLPIRQLQVSYSDFGEVHLPRKHQQGYSMAQPLLYQQYTTDNSFSAAQQWQRQQAGSREYKPIINAQTECTASDMAYSHDVWGEAAAFNQGFLPNSDLNAQSYGTAESDGAPYSNSGFVYSVAAAQGYDQHGGLQSWPTFVPRSLNSNGPNSDPNDTLSPKSYTSEPLNSETQPFTPATSMQLSSDNSKWRTYGNEVSYPGIKISSPDNASYMVRDAGPVGYSAQQQSGLGLIIAPSPAGPSRQYNGLPSPDGDSDYPYSQQNSPGSAPRDPFCDRADISFGQRAPQATSAPFVGVLSGYQGRKENDKSFALTAWNDPRPRDPAQIHFHDYFQVPRTMDVQAQRIADDEILLKGKRDGLTYKEIRKKMHAKPAESTLRGRYRSLTKPRKDRVRKPVWQPKDVRLLKDYVERELTRIDANHHQCLEYNQRLAKIQWKKVADFIHASGGSYHFGNSTCKRKWMELSPGS